MGLLIAVFISVVFIGCAGVTLLLIVTGNWTWDEGVRRDALRMHNGGMAAGTALAWLLLGAHAVLAAWPVLVGFLAVRVAATALLDALYGVGMFKRGAGRPTRVIRHRDGALAEVDAPTGARYRRIEGK